MRVVLWALAVVVVSAASLVHAEAKSKGSACKTDSECVLVPADCCGCAGGGKQKAIPAREKAKYERARLARCAETLCSTVMSGDSSCAATAAAVCKEGQCSLAPSR